MNTWESNALEYQYSAAFSNGQGSARTWGQCGSVSDALIYPGIYSPSGYDLMSILINIGPVDHSCPIVLCDLKQPDRPIVYASDAFYQLTGYSKSEVLGKNCRFLQAPNGQVEPTSVRKYVDKDTITKMRKAVEKNYEIQLDVLNFKKGGQQFTNILSIIPVAWGTEPYRFSVGLLCEHDG